MAVSKQYEETGNNCQPVAGNCTATLLTQDLEFGAKRPYFEGKLAQAAQHASIAQHQTAHPAYRTTRPRHGDKCRREICKPCDLEMRKYALGVRLNFVSITMYGN